LSSKKSTSSTTSSTNDVAQTDAGNVADAEKPTLNGDLKLSTEILIDASDCKDVDNGDPVEVVVIDDKK
jgi:hypothetical protein